MPATVEPALLWQLLRDLPMGVAAFAGPEYRLTFFNEQFQRLAGGRLQLEQPLASCLPEVVAQGLVIALDEVSRTGQAHHHPDIQLCLNDSATGETGEIIDCTCQAVSHPSGWVQGISMYITDNSLQAPARPSTAHQLAEQRAFYEMLLEEVPAGLVALDPEHRYLYANPVMFERHGFQPALLGQTNAAVCAARGYPPAVATERQHHFDQAVRERDHHIWEEMAVGSQGIRHWLRYLRPVFHPDGSLRLVVSLALDMTARRLGAALRQEQQFT